MNAWLARVYVCGFHKLRIFKRLCFSVASQFNVCLDAQCNARAVRLFNLRSMPRRLGFEAACCHDSTKINKYFLPLAIHKPLHSGVAMHRDESVFV